jgi:hypothetical protein
VAPQKFRVLNTCSTSTWLLAVRHVKWLLVSKIGAWQSAFKHVPRQSSFLGRNVENTCKYIKRAVLQRGLGQGLKSVKI